MKILVLLTLLLTVSACDTRQTRCKEAADHSPTARIGTGVKTFESIDDDDVLPAIWGPQGGHHVWGSVMVTGLNPGAGEMVNPNPDIDGGMPVYEPRGEDVVSVTFSMAFYEDQLASYEVPFLGFFEGTSEQSELLGKTVFVDLTDIADTYPGVKELPVEMSVTVEDACGTVVSDRQTFFLDTERGEDEW